MVDWLLSCSADPEVAPGPGGRWVDGRNPDNPEAKEAVLKGIYKGSII